MYRHEQTLCYCQSGSSFSWCHSRCLFRCSLFLLQARHRDKTPHGGLLKARGGEDATACRARCQNRTLKEQGKGTGAGIRTSSWQECMLYVCIIAKDLQIHSKKKIQSQHTQTELNQSRAIWSLAHVVSSNGLRTSSRFCFAVRVLWVMALKSNKIWRFCITGIEP